MKAFIYIALLLGSRSFTNAQFGDDDDDDEAPTPARRSTQQNPYSRPQYGQPTQPTAYNPYQQQQQQQNPYGQQQQNPYGQQQQNPYAQQQQNPYAQQQQNPYAQQQPYNPYQQQQQPNQYQPVYQQQPRPQQSYNPYQQQQQPRPQSNYNPYAQQQPRPQQSYRPQPQQSYRPQPQQQAPRPSYQQPAPRPSYQQPAPRPSYQQPAQQQPRPTYNPYPQPQASPSQQPPVYQQPTPQVTPGPVYVTPTAPPLTLSPTATYNTNVLPTNWGPPRAPFGTRNGVTTITGYDGLPTGICTTCGDQTIATTTESGFKAPAPFKTTCGGLAYDEYAVSNALVGGCFYLKKNQTIGGSEYPKAFDNQQGFQFGTVRGPFFEFPLMKDASYVGGDTGPDFVIFSGDCFLAGEITRDPKNTQYKGWNECTEEF